MDTFFAITSHMMKNVGVGLGKMFNGMSLLTGSISGFLVVLTTVLFCNSSNKKTFINKNKKLIVLVFIVEIIFVWLSQDIKIVKAEFILLLVCAFAILLKSFTKTKKTSSKQRKTRSNKQ